MPTKKDSKKTIKELADLLGKLNLAEIEIEENGVRIRVARGTGGGSAAPAPQAAPEPAAKPETPPPPVDVSQCAGCVKSPMVGTVYTAPEPGADPFVGLGDTVKKGQTLLIVEAMKVMNQITAHMDGKIKEILISNGQPVEFDQPLIVIE